jgi:hypothetical protein
MSDDKESTETTLMVEGVRPESSAGPKPMAKAIHNTDSVRIDLGGVQPKASAGPKPSSKPVKK